MDSAVHIVDDERHRILVEGIADSAVLMLHADGTIGSWNLGAQRIKGYRAHEIIGQPMSRLYLPSDAAAGEPQRNLEIARTTGVFRGEGWRVRKDGSRFWASVTINALRAADGHLVGYAKVTHDITERAIEADWRQVLVDAAPCGMLAVAESGYIRLANPRAVALFGLDAAEMAGLSIDRLFPDAAGELADRRPALVLEAMRSSADRAQEFIACRSDGSRFPVEVTFNTTTTARGPIVVAAITDISERHAADQARRHTEDELIKANRLMQMAEDMAHYGHWRLDLETKELFWSDEVYRTYGLEPGSIPTLEAGIAAYDPQGVDIGDIVRRASLDGEPFTFESRIVRPDGTLRDVRSAGRGERDANGNIVALVGIFQDITDRKDAERERERLIERVTVATQAGKVGIWEWGIVSQTMTWDAHMFALYGCTEATTTASYDFWEAALDARDRERVMHELDDALCGRKALDTEFRVVWPNGERHTIRVQATVLRNAVHEPVRMIAINWDITEVRSLADELREEKERQSSRERERLYEHERMWSTTFQRAVLPLTLPSLAGFSFDAVYEPGLAEAQVGGDWYDAVPLVDGRVLVAIGDVAGSGLEAAVVVGVVRQIMRGIAQLHANPMVILDAADRALRLEYPGVYVSAWVGLVDIVTRTIAYASAGHPPPLVVDSNETIRELVDPATMLIGLREGSAALSTTVPLGGDEMLVLYTDGITEAGRDPIAGNRRLREAAALMVRTPARHPAQAMKRHVIPGGSRDDVAMLVVQIDCEHAEQFIERWNVNVLDGEAASAVRHCFGRSLQKRGLSQDDCSTAELVFGELIGNVVRHARHAQDVEIAVDHRGTHSVLHVLDRGSGFQHISRLPSDLYAENGRGLFLIDALTLDFTVTERFGGGSHARAVLRGSAQTARY